MKLYEFTYIDTDNLANKELNKRVRKFLQSVCEEQGWHPSFTLKQKSAPAKSKVHTAYQFEVHGSYLNEAMSFFDDLLEPEGSKE